MVRRWGQQRRLFVVVVLLVGIGGVGCTAVLEALSDFPSTQQVDYPSGIAAASASRHDVEVSEEDERRFVHLLDYVVFWMLLMTLARGREVNRQHFRCECEDAK